MSDDFKYSPSNRPYDPMMHIKTSESSSTKEVYYSAYKLTSSQSENIKYTVKNYTKSPEIIDPTQIFNAQQSKVFETTEIRGEIIHEEVQNKEIEITRLQAFVNIFIQAGNSIKEKFRTYFKFSKKRK